MISFKEIQTLIEKENKIVFIRHKYPDYDAIGSQSGLFFSIKNRYPNKELHMVGDDSNMNFLNLQFEASSKEIFENSLTILTDQSCANQLTDDYYKYSKKLVIMDHHSNEPDIKGLYHIDSSRSSASELICEFLIDQNYIITPLAAEELFAGIVADSGRFQYKGTTEKSFKCAQYLTSLGIDIYKIYRALEKTESVEAKRLKGLLYSNFIKDGEYAFYVFDEMTLKELGFSALEASRATINSLSGIEGVKYYAVFSPENDKVVAEFRSKDKPIVEFSRSYGGGGHALACGATFDRDLLDKCISEFLKLGE